MLWCCVASLWSAVDLWSGCGLAFGRSSAHYSANHHVLQFGAGFCGLSGVWRARGLLCHQSLVTSVDLFALGLGAECAILKSDLSTAVPNNPVPVSVGGAFLRIMSHFQSQRITPNGFQSEDLSCCFCKFCGLLVDWTLFFSN